MTEKQSPYAAMSQSELRNLAGQLTVASCFRSPHKSFDDAFARAQDAYEHIYEALLHKMEEVTPSVSAGMNLK